MRKEIIELMLTKAIENGFNLLDWAYQDKLEDKVWYEIYNDYCIEINGLLKRRAMSVDRSIIDIITSAPFIDSLAKYLWDKYLLLKEGTRLEKDEIFFNHMILKEWELKLLMIELISKAIYETTREGGNKEALNELFINLLK